MEKWRLLRRSLRNNSNNAGGSNNECTASSFHPFPDLMPRLAVTDDGWYRVSPSNCLIKQPQYSSCDITEMFTGKYTGFLRTGLVRVWPAEDYLAFKCWTVGMKWLRSMRALGRRNSDTRRTAADDRLRVVELGAGMTGLAGLALYRRVVANAAIAATAKHETNSSQKITQVSIHLTDGNPECVDNLKQIIDRNIHDYIAETGSDNHRVNYHHELSASQLLWGSRVGGEEEDEYFDLILAADCLYQTDLHHVLIESIHALLATTGLAIICAPTRQPSMSNFSQTVKQDGRLVCVAYEWPLDEPLWEYHARHLHFADTDGCYDPDRHFPRLLLLAKDERFINEFLADA